MAGERHGRGMLCESAFTDIQDCDCTVSHHGLRERPCGSQKKPNFFGHPKHYGQRFFQIPQTGYFEIWRREVTATYRDWKEDYTMETTCWLLPEHRHCNVLKSITLCPWNIQNITCVGFVMWCLFWFNIPVHMWRKWRRNIFLLCASDPTDLRLNVKCTTLKSEWH